MWLGYRVVEASLVCAIGSLLAYALSGRIPRLRFLARACFIGSILLVFAAEAVLQYLLIAGRYDIIYVYNFSERDLPLWYKIAGAWAGQEGSFLLWTVWTAIYGLVLLGTTRTYERWVLMVYSGVIAFLMSILAYQSPFNRFSDLPPGVVPETGFGLNASLENIWMTIHPPIIFAGFAALTVPFAYALAALMRNEYQEWIIRVRPWAIYGTTMLGTGLVLGGIWAYETLGWGGFWAWDPVENCSFFPWLASAALVHALMLQVNRSKMVRWTPLLAALPFLLFMYGTFLTRSGLLSDVSVHSFVSMEKNALWILIGMVGAGTLGTLALWGVRYRKMPRPASPEKTVLLSRETAVRFAVILLSLSAWIVIIGTSYPLLTQWLQGKPVKLEPPFYNQVHAPWLLITAILVAIAPMMVWKGMKLDDLLQRITKAWIATLAFAFGIYFLGGVRDPLALLLTSFLFFAVAANLGSLWRRIGTSRVTIGGFLTHAGLAIGLMGLIVSNVYERKQGVVLSTRGLEAILADDQVPIFEQEIDRVMADGNKIVIPKGFKMNTQQGYRVLIAEGKEVVVEEHADGEKVILPKGVDATVFGYHWHYLGMTGDPHTEKQNKVRLEVTAHQEKFIAEPRYYEDMREGEPKPVHWPWIKRSWDHDLYVSFYASPQVDAEPLKATLQVNGTATIEPYHLRFLGFTQHDSMGEDRFRVGARVEVRKAGWTEPVVVEPAIQVEGDKQHRLPAPLPDGAHMVIGGMNATDRQIEVQLLNVPGMPETAPAYWIPLEVYYKPFTILVWLGPPMALLGGLLASLRRARDSRYALAKLEAGSRQWAGGTGKEEIRNRKQKKEKVHV